MGPPPVRKLTRPWFKRLLRKSRIIVVKLNNLQSANESDNDMSVSFYPPTANLGLFKKKKKTLPTAMFFLIIRFALASVPDVDVTARQPWRRGLWRWPPDCSDI